jgi:rubrerythrin
MPKHATVRIEDADMKMNEPASAEEMAHREEIASLLLSLMDRPVTREEKDLWREFEADLEEDRPKFR